MKMILNTKIYSNSDTIKKYFYVSTREDPWRDLEKDWLENKDKTDQWPISRCKVLHLHNSSLIYNFSK